MALYVIYALLFLGGIAFAAYVISRLAPIVAACVILPCVFVYGLFHRRPARPVNLEITPDD